MNRLLMTFAPPDVTMTSGRKRRRAHKRPGNRTNTPRRPAQGYAAYHRMQPLVVEPVYVFGAAELSAGNIVPIEDLDRQVRFPR